MRRRPIIYLAIFVAILIFLAWMFSDIFVYVLISIVLSSVLRPLTNYLVRIQIFKIRIPRIVAVIFSFLTLILFITLFVIVFIPLISDQVTLISELNYDRLYERLTQPLSNFETFLISNNITNEPDGFIVSTLKEKIVGLFSSIQIGEMLNQVLSFTGNFFVGLLAVTFITFFFLYEMGSMRKKIIEWIPNKYFEMTIAAYNKIERLLSNYLTGLLIQMISIFTVASIGLSILGVKYALTIALFAAVANLIPYLGPILGALFGILVGITTNLNVATEQEILWLIIKISSVFGVVQLLDNIFLQPLIFSKSVKAHPLEIFIIIFAGASLAQIPGMIAAIPVYTVLRVSLAELYNGYRSYRIFRVEK